MEKYIGGALIYVGIPNSAYKTYLLKKSGKGEVVKINPLLLAGPDCGRHLEILTFFDEFGKPKIISPYEKSEYFKYQIRVGKSQKTIQKKLLKFYKLYNSIKNKYDYKQGYIIVTEDGIRLDGSHRSAIVSYLKIDKIKVKEIDWKKMLSGKNAKNFGLQINKQKKVYGIL